MRGKVKLTPTERGEWLGKELARLADEEPSFIAEIGGPSGRGYEPGGIPGASQESGQTTERKEATEAQSDHPGLL